MELELAQPSPALNELGINALERLTPEQRTAAQQKVKELVNLDETGLSNLGTEYQKNATQDADRLVLDARTKDSGPVGDTLSELVQNINNLNANSLLGYTKRWFSDLPILGRQFDRLHRFLDRYERLSSKLDHITESLYKHRDQLQRDADMFKVMIAKNARYREDIIFILAVGELKLEELKKQLATMEANARPGDTVAADAISDQFNLITALDRHLGDLRLAEQISMQVGTYMRMVRTSDQALIGKIQSSLMTTIPLWQYQAALAIGVINVKKSTQILAALRDANNKMYANMATLLGQTLTETARETERGIIEVTTLTSTNQKLIAAIDETRQIQLKGMETRRVEADKLATMRTELTISLQTQGRLS